MRKRALRSLSLSYPKKDWRAGPNQSLAGRAPSILLFVWHRLQNIICWCHTLRRIGGAPTRQSFFGYGNDKDFKACFLLTQLICDKHVHYTMRKLKISRKCKIICCIFLTFLFISKHSTKSSFYTIKKGLESVNIHF